MAYEQPQAFIHWARKMFLCYFVSKSYHVCATFCHEVAKKDRFAAFAARFCPLSCKPLPLKPQNFRTLAANQKHNGAVPASQRCCSCFTAVFFPFHSCAIFLQRKIMERAANLLLPQRGMFTETEPVKVTLGRVVFQS